MHLASYMLFVVYTLLALYFIAGGFFMMQTVNGKKVVGVIDYDLAYCEDLFTTLYYQCFGENHIMRSDPLLSFYFTQLVRRLEELAHSNECTEHAVVCLSDL